MPSTNKLASARVKSRNRLAKFLLSFCGIASFGVFTILTSTNTNALSTVSNQVSVTIPGSIAVRLLDSTATSEISYLSFDLTPTPQGTSQTKRTIVDVGTSNPTGYKLYMQSNYQAGGSYTTNLVHTDSSVTDVISTNTTSSSLYWNYVNPLLNTTSVIPAHNHPDKIAQHFETINSDQTPIDINVSVDNTIVSGTYENQLLFSAVGNPTIVNYSITFNMDGGEPAINKMEATAAAGAYTFTLPDTIPTKSGFQFRDWKDTTSSATYNPGDRVTIYSDEEFTGDLTLIAEYDPTYTYIISYDCNGGTGCPGNDSFGPTIDTTHNFTIPSVTVSKTGYSFTGFKGSDNNTYQPGDTVTLASGSPNISLTAQYSINQYTLTVKPNGGTWNGSTSDQTFTQNYNTTKTIANPSEGATYSISYNDNGQGAEYTGTPTSITRSFTGWTHSGAGSLSSGTYTFGAGEGTLTAEYNNTSDSFTLPAISKTGHSCYWASDTTGTKFGDGGDSKTITSNTELYAYCTVNQYTLTINPNGGKWDNKTTNSTFTQNYNTTKTIADATNGPTYTISYNMGSTSIATPTSPTSIDRPFQSWTKGGTGDWNATNKVWTFGAGNGTLTANWNATSNSFNLPDITNAKTGYTCKWHQGSATGAEKQNNVTITGNTTFYAVCTAKTYTVTLNGNGATTAGSGSTSVTYLGTTLGSITNPQRKYNVSGFTAPAGNNANGATVSSTSTITSTYTFNGWYKESGATNKIASNATTPALIASTSYTNASKQWTNDGNVILYAGWSSAAIKLPKITKTGHTCGWTTSSTGATSIAYASEASFTPTGNTTLYGVCTINQYTLTVDPNGGTWSGSTSSQTFKQNYNTTKTISNPTAGPSYTISYNANGQGAEYTGSPNSVTRPFSSWSLSGSGSFAGSTYTYGAGNGTLTAQYSTTSNSFTLPAISKTGHTCKWAEGSASGTQYTGGTSRTITGDTTYYAVCTANSYTVNITNSNTTSGESSLSVPYGGSKTVTVTPSSGYYLSAVTCPTGYTCSGYNTGSSYTDEQTVTLTNDSATSTQTLTFTGDVLMTMQNSVAISQCKNASTDTAYTLEDTRDNNSYTVKKLADGKCWMTQNLRLVGKKTLTSADSDVSSDYALPATSAGSGWCTTVSTSCYDQSKLYDTGSTTYGVYYNWYTATAGTGKYATTSGNASSSVCPKGWKLPTSSEYSTLLTKYNTPTLIMNVPAFVKSGSISGAIQSQGTQGLYNTRTAYNAENAYHLVLQDTVFVTQYYGGKHAGRTIRCVAQ